MKLAIKFDNLTFNFRIRKIRKSERKIEGFETFKIIKKRKRKFRKRISVLGWVARTLKKPSPKVCDSNANRYTYFPFTCFFITFQAISIPAIPNHFRVHLRAVQVDVQFKAFSSTWYVVCLVICVPINELKIFFLF